MYFTLLNHRNLTLKKYLPTFQKLNQVCLLQLAPGFLFSSKASLINFTVLSVEHQTAYQASSRKDNSSSPLKSLSWPLRVISFECLSFNGGKRNGEGLFRRTNTQVPLPGCRSNCTWKVPFKAVIWKFLCEYILMKAWLSICIKTTKSKKKK